MAKHGSIGEFDRSQEDWVSYCEQLEQYFVANDVKNADKQRAILLSVWCIDVPTDPEFGGTEQANRQNVHRICQVSQRPSYTTAMQRYTFNKRVEKQ